jgi:hypothetical protein
MLRFILLFAMFLIPSIAFAQENGTPVATPTQQVTTSPQPNLQYLPQKAYIVPVGPNGEVAAVPYQDAGGTSTAQATGIVGILTAIGTGLWAKMAAKKDVKQTNSALLDTKEVQKEIARVMYNFQPDQSKALSDAPAIKLENLEKDKAEFAEKVAKD